MSGPYDAIGRGLSDFGAGVGAFIRKKGIAKSKLALEREKQDKLKGFVKQKTDYLRQQIGPDDTDLYNQLTEAENTPESLSLLEPEVERRSKLRGEQAKADEATRKELDTQTKAEEKLRRKETILQKQLELNQDMPQEIKSRVATFLDGTDEGYEAARDEFRAWKPEKAAKMSIAEQKAAIMEDILTLGDNDLNKGLETAKAEHPEVYRTALKFGVKPNKVEATKDPADPYVEQITRDFGVYQKSERGQLEKKTIKDFAVKWLEDRKEFIPEEAQKGIIGKLYPERTSVGVSGASGDPDATRADEIVAKPDDQVTPEEEAWLKSYYEKIKDKK